MTIALHADGYADTEVEELVPVHEIHQARCTLCDWTGEEFDELNWTGAEEEAVEHYRDFHAEDDEEDEDDDPDID